MKLLGSKKELDIREQLIKKHNYLFNNKEDNQLINVLRLNFTNLKTAYILNWIQDQEEDTFTILINTDIITLIVLDYSGENLKSVIETISEKEYLIGLSKSEQIKYAVAIDLAKKDIASMKEK